MRASRFRLSGFALACALAASGTAALAERPEAHALPAEPVMLAQHHGRMTYEDRRRLREEINSARRDVYRDRGAEQRSFAEREARQREGNRLREEVRAGRMTREDAIQQYRERPANAPPPPPQQAPSDDARAAEIERLREAVRSGRIKPEEGRERIREQRMQRAVEGGRFTPEERDRLRRDILDANRELQRR